MAWLDLRTEIEAEFSELNDSRFYDIVSASSRVVVIGNRSKSQIRRTDPVKRAWEAAGQKCRRRERRGARAKDRPPCPHCKLPVERVGKIGKIPKYCQSSCMRAAKWARWYAKHGEERNARRAKGVAS